MFFEKTKNEKEAEDGPFLKDWTHVQKILVKTFLLNVEN